MSNIIDVGTNIPGSVFGACFMSLATLSHSRFQLPESQEHSIGQNSHKVISFHSPHSCLPYDK